MNEEEQQSRVSGCFSRVVTCGIWLAGTYVVLALLLALLEHWIQEANTVSPRTSCMINLKQIHTALSMYSDDYDHWLPPPASRVNDDPATLPSLLWPYIRNGQIWRCPGDRNLADTYDGTPGDWSVSYGYNWLGLTRSGKPLRLTAVRSPEQILAFVETDTYLVTPRTLLGQFGGSPPAYRHQGTANVAFLDGHGRGMRQEELEPTLTGGTGLGVPKEWNLPSRQHSSRAR